MSTTRVFAQPGTPFIEIERDFAAPRELLFRAWTDPELVVRWLGPRRYAMVIDRWEVRDGGAWRYVHAELDGSASHGFRGVFHGAPSVDGMVQTFEYEGAPGHVSLDALTFEEHADGTTTVRIRSVHQSVAARDAMVAAGMEGGLNEGFERLDDLVASGALGQREGAVLSSGARNSTAR